MRLFPERSPYCGILKNLRAALATYAGHGDSGRGGEGGDTDPAKPDEELLADLAESIAFVRAFLLDRNASLDDIIEKNDEMLLFLLQLGTEERAVREGLNEEEAIKCVFIELSTVFVPCTSDSLILS